MKADKRCLQIIAKNAQTLLNGYCIQTLTIIVTKTQTILAHTYEDGEVITLCTIKNCCSASSRMHNNTTNKRKTKPRFTTNG